MSSAIAKCSCPTKVCDDYVRVGMLDSCSSSSSAALPSADVLRSMTHVPAALAVSMQQKKSKRKSQKGEVNKTLGNDSVPPWLKPNGSLKVYRVRQMLAPQFAMTTSATVPTFYGLSFNIASLDNFSSYALVFDQYRIDLIEVLVVPDVTENSVSSGVASSTGLYSTVIDYDDATVPTTMTQLGGYASCQESTTTAQHYHRFKPMFATAVYSGTFTSFAASRGWIDCASPNVQHYGFKMGALAAGITQGINLVITYHVSFRATH